MSVLKLLHEYDASPICLAEQLRATSEHKKPWLQKTHCGRPGRGAGGRSARTSWLQTRVHKEREPRDERQDTRDKLPVERRDGTEGTDGSVLPTERERAVVSGH